MRLLRTGQHSKNLRNNGRRYQRALSVLLLLVFTLTKAITPVGFMPSALSEGSLFVLCHGNPASAQLLLSLSQHQHQHQHHDSKNKHSLSDSICSFSALGFLGTLHSHATTVFNPIPLTEQTPWVFWVILPLSRYNYPPSRAPPASFS